MIANAAVGSVLGVSVFLAAYTLGIAAVFRLGLDGLGPAAAIGAAMAVLRLRVILWVAFGILVAVLLLVRYTEAIAGPAQSFMRSDPLGSPVDAVVVLSFGIEVDGLLTSHAADRLAKGLELIERDVATRLIITREARMVDGRRVTSHRDQHRMISRFRVPPAEVIDAGDVASTRDEAVSVARIASQRGFKRVALVTSPMHTWRACAAFEKAGVAVTCIPCDPRGIGFLRVGDPYDRVATFGAWIYEVAATLRYRQLGWL